MALSWLKTRYLLKQYFDVMKPVEFLLPRALEKYRLRFLATALPFLRLSPQKESIQNSTQSQIGGTPFLPTGAEYPLDKNGKPMVFLAQINFEDGPGLSPFPLSGLLQFFIADDGMYGSESGSEGFEIRFFEKELLAIKAIEDFSFLLAFENAPINWKNAFPFKLERAFELVPSCDYAFRGLFGDDFFDQFGEHRWDLKQAYDKLYGSVGHKMGGYSCFTQSDPRDPDKPQMLLLQIDSDPNIESMWGDMGVGHFFIDEADLRVRDFSKVRYHWDCY